MIVVCATDSSFVDLAGPLLRSIAVNGEIPEAEIVVLSDGLTREEKEWLRISASGLRTRIIDIEGQQRARMARFPTTRHETPATFFRLLIPDLLPEVSGRVLYLDVDVIVNGSLRPLFELPLNGNPLAAVPNAGDPDFHGSLNRQVGRLPESPNINSGVLLMDLARWREMDASDRCFEVLTWAPNLKFADQDAINAVLGDSVTVLDRTWNFWSQQARSFSRDEYVAARVVHFTSWRKPNLVECTHPARDLYLMHRAHTPWRDSPLLTRQMRGWRRVVGWLLLKLHETRRPGLRPATTREIARSASPSPAGEPVPEAAP